MFKTEYDILLEELEQKGQVRNLTEEQSSEIIVDIYAGYNDFVTVQRKNEKESEQDLQEIVLNA